MFACLSNVKVESCKKLHQIYKTMILSSNFSLFQKKRKKNFPQSDTLSILQKNFSVILKHLLTKCADLKFSSCNLTIHNFTNLKLFCIQNNFSRKSLFESNTIKYSRLQRIHPNLAKSKF